ncbi:MAG: signal recognition particle-docking protein FtsY [Clostridiales bacterium]|jgi:fused signal recognition particle receptor|nr:signal recognition particle-docking protein FtsY [Clostridiales bacterium]
MGFFSKIAEGLKKTKEAVSKKIFEVFKAASLDDAFYESLEEALIFSDMGAAAAEDIVADLRDRVFRNKVTDSAEAKKLLKKIIAEKIDYDVPPYNYPLLIMIAGVNGVGKTTAIGKLAKHFKDAGKSVVIAAADTYRAAASEQLEVWAERAGVKIIIHGEGSDPAAVVFDAVSSAKARKTDVVLVDTAGRLQNKKNLMEELKKINRVIEREYSDADVRNYIVLDATTGQNAISQVGIFDEAIDIDGIILTKLDGTAKGGVVVAIACEKEIPVVFVGVGEKITDLLPFDAEDFVNGIL